MTASSPKKQEPIAGKEKSGARKERSNETRGHAPVRAQLEQQLLNQDPPAAGAHAARHLINEDATPGAGALPSHAHRSGKEVDGGAG